MSNVGTVGLSWAASSTQGWVTVDPSEGNLAPGGSPNGVTVLINTNAQSLSNGVYTATVIFSNLISRTTQTRAVQLTVAEPPQPPPAPCCPIPTNNATGVPVPTLLSWNNVQAIRHAAPPSIPANGSGSAKREDEIQTASAGAREAVGSGDSQPRISGASTLVIETGAAISNSVLAVLDNLGHPYDFVHTDVLSSLDLSGYNTVILGMDGGLVNYASMAHLANAINAGGKLIVLGGSSYQPFVSGLNDFFIRVNTNSYMWSTVSGSPDISVTDPSHPLATGLPLAYNFVNSSATYYMARVTDGSAAMVALNGDGYACLSTKPVGTGTVILFINSVYQNYWSNLGDSNVLRTVIANALQFGTSAATYDVYFGTNTAAMTLIASNLTQTTCDPGLLGFDTTYYWQVIASNPAGTTPGPVWSFTTELCPSSSAI